MDICPFPLGKKVVGCKCVFMIKARPDHKVHLVVKGYSQAYDVGDDETFSCVPKIVFVGIYMFLASI